MNKQILKDIKKEFKKMGFEVLKDEIIDHLDIRNFDEVVEDNLCYWEVGNLPIEYINTKAMVDGDEDYTKVGDMYWKNAFFEEEDKLIKKEIIKQINKE